MSFKINKQQLRALSKLTRAWQTAGELFETRALLNSLEEVGLVEKEVQKRGVIKYRMTKLPKPRKTHAQKRDLARHAAWKPNYEVTPRWVVAAAMLKNGRIVTGARHFDKVMRQQMEAAEGLKWWQGCDQGFIDQFGDFLTREEAWVIAEKNGQIRREVSSPGYLFSENLY